MTSTITHVDVTEQQAERTQAQARRTGREAREAVELAGQTAESFMRDLRYAAIGAADLTAAGVRKAVELSPLRPKRAVATMRQSFEELVRRGRLVSQELRDDDDVREARVKTSVAKSRVKAVKDQAEHAARSVADAAEAQAEVVEETAETLGKKRK